MSTSVQTNLQSARAVEQEHFEAWMAVKGTGHPEEEALEAAYRQAASATDAIQQQLNKQGRAVVASGDVDGLVIDEGHDTLDREGLRCAVEKIDATGKGPFGETDPEDVAETRRILTAMQGGGSQ